MTGLRRHHPAGVTVRVLVAVCAVLLLLGSGVGARPASAHALYERSQPATGGRLETPGQIQVWFTEPVEPAFSEIEVLDTSRKRVDLQDSHAAPGEPKALVVSVPELPDGTYMVAWRALSAVDGHVTRGVFPLVVGAGGLQISLEEEPVYLPAPLDVLARWVMYFGALALAGGYLFRRVVATPALASVGATATLAAFVARQRRLGLWLCLVVGLSMVLGMLVQAANAANVEIWQALGSPVVRLLGTQIGAIWLTRLGWLAILALVLWRAPGRFGDWAGAIVGSCMLLAISLISHAAAVPSGAWLAIGLDWLHQLGAAAWIGGLFSFALLMIVTRVGPDRQRLPALLATMVPRFTTVAVGSVVVLVLTGLFHSWLQVKSISALGTVHGLSLTVKVLFILPMLVLGGLNMAVWRPRLAALLGGRRAGQSAPAEQMAGRLGRAVTIEAALAIVVLLATAVLTAVQPAREEYARKVRPLELTAQATDVNVRLTMTPARPGPNEFVADLTGAVAPPNEIQRVQLRFTNLDDDLGASLLTLTPRDDGTFGAVSTNVTVDGTWQIEVIVRRRGLDDVRTAFRAPVVTPDAAAQPPSLEGLPNPGNLPPRQLVSIALMATGLALTYWISRTRDVRQRERATLYAASFAVVMIGGVLYARAAVTPALPQDVRSLRNPFPPDTASIARGRELYEQQCASCHGLAGRGDGPLAASLRPRPADFRVHMAAGHTDGELFTWLSRGVPGTAMPAFEAQLAEQDRWHLVNFIRGFAPTNE
ncbi:MAG: copper resistance protein CopC [Chloroflexi bacterium]|nr:copper resistance protein CopC [Chloroflexota bacterium]